MPKLTISGATNSTLLGISNQVVSIVAQYQSNLLTVVGARQTEVPLNVLLADGLASNNVAITFSNGVAINTAYFLSQDNNPLNLTNVLVHELVHFYTRFPGTTPPCWTEGVADYVRYKLGLTNDWSGPGCSAEYPHYTAGYWCAGAMLLWLDHEYGPDAVRALIKRFSKRNYSDECFRQLTGADMETLWNRFQQTSYSVKYNFPREHAVDLSAEATAAFKKLIASNALPGFPPGAHGYFFRTNFYPYLMQGHERTFAFRPDNGTNIYFYVMRKVEDGWSLRTNWSTRVKVESNVVASPKVGR